jgi:predicted PurR-regulated permease PerM
MPYSYMPHQKSTPPHAPAKAATEAQRRHMDAVWLGRAARLFCLLGAALVAIFLFRYALPCLTPFLLAWLLSFPIRKGARMLQQKYRIPRRLGAFILLLAVVLPLGTLVVYAGERLIA